MSTLQLAKDGSRRGLWVRTAAHNEANRQARLGKKLAPSTIEKLTAIARTNAADPEWRRKVSEGTIKNYNHKAQRAGVRRALRQRGLASFFTGGQDAPTLPPYVSDYLWLERLGYVREYQVQYNKTTRYRLDFAHPEARICIEIDGSSHRHPDRQAKDRLRDARLREKGWKVIRVREW